MFSIGVCSAVINFNDAANALNDVFHNLCISPGVLFELGSAEKDLRRVSQANKQSTEHVKNKRKQLRAIKKKYVDANLQKERDESYASGSF